MDGQTGSSQRRDELRDDTSLFSLEGVASLLEQKINRNTRANEIQGKQ